MHDLIKTYASEHSRIVFNGNGYSAEWVEKSKELGLPNLKSMVEAIPALTTEKTMSLSQHLPYLQALLCTLLPPA